MADTNNKSATEQNPVMDYSEHERTYDLFLKLAKYTTIACIALMVAMAWGFFVGGWFSGAIVFIVVLAAGLLIL